MSEEELQLCRRDREYWYTRYRAVCDEVAHLNDELRTSQSRIETATEIYRRRRDLGLPSEVRLARLMMDALEGNIDVVI